MHNEKTTPSHSADPEAFTPDIIPIHQSRNGGPIIEMAGNQIRSREMLTGAAAELQADIAHLQELRELPPRRNIFKRRRQKRALNDWLSRNHYVDADEAHSDLFEQHASTAKDAEAMAADVEQVWLPKVRESLGELHEEDKDYADKLFRAHDFPNDILDACDQQSSAAGRKPNILNWLSQKPSAEDPFGADDQQLESVLLWNASCTERMATNPEGVARTISGHFQQINQRVAEGKLDESWANAKPDISRVIIGDIMDVRFLGYGDIRRGGTYNRENKSLTLWPYELEEENSTAHICKHECDHALGGFKEKWLNEGFTEAFTLIIEDKDPFEESNVYNSNRLGIKKLLEGADLTCKDVSAFFIGHDVESNEAQLHEFLTQAYDGNDVLGAVNAAYRESFQDDDNKLHDPKTEDEAFFVAALTALTISDLFKDAQRNADAITEHVKQLALDASSLKYIAFKHAYLFFAKMADR
ncbi:MAG TPA: hypothetical protein VLA88_06385 [Candidatus Saccharimonadales bacterium]|nr:hypothetical protein [Candidatus Saccharimonadales bacterium]